MKPSLCNFLQPPVTSSLLRPNSSVSDLFSKMSITQVYVHKFHLKWDKIQFILQQTIMILCKKSYGTGIKRPKPAFVSKTNKKHRYDCIRLNIYTQKVNQFSFICFWQPQQQPFPFSIYGNSLPHSLTHSPTVLICTF
jgi:hypothetical protein